MARVAMSRRRVLMLRLLDARGRGRRLRRGGGSRRGRRGRGRRARAFRVAVCDMSGDGRPGDVDRVRLSGAGHVADVDLLLTRFFVTGGRRALGRRGRSATRGGGRRRGAVPGRGRPVVGVLLLRLALVVIRFVGEIVLSAHRRRQRAGRRRGSRRADGRGSARRLRGDLGETDTGSRREGEPDDHSDNGAAPESVESLLHWNLLVLQGVWPYP